MFSRKCAAAVTTAERLLSALQKTKIAGKIHFGRMTHQKNIMTITGAKSAPPEQLPANWMLFPTTLVPEVL